MSVSVSQLQLQSGLPFDDTLTIIAIAVVIAGVLWYLGTSLRAYVRTDIAEIVRAGLLLVLAITVAFVLLRRWNATTDALEIAGFVLRGSRVSPNVTSTTSVFESAVVLFVGNSQSPRHGPLRCVSKRFEFSQEFIGIVRPFSNAP